MKNITFAERLKEARKSARLSQQALADKIGRTKSTISRWESGERNPKMFENELSYDEAKRIVNGLIDRVSVKEDSVDVSFKFELE